MDTSKYINDEFVTSKAKIQNAALEALTVDELETLEVMFFKKSDELAKSGLKTKSDDILRMSIKYKNMGFAARQMWAVKQYA